ncbi:hypothetical protein AOQ84DRAFT_219863, partial [Glonium stellatum]
ARRTSSRIPTGSVCAQATLSTSSRGTALLPLATSLPELPGCHGNLAAVGSVAHPLESQPALLPLQASPERAPGGKTLTTDELSVVKPQKALAYPRVPGLSFGMYSAVWPI